MATMLRIELGIFISVKPISFVKYVNLFTGNLAMIGLKEIALCDFMLVSLYYANW